MPEAGGGESDDAVVIALGSNLSGAYRSIEELLESAMGRLPAFGLRLVNRSSWWTSLAWPDPLAPAFVNGVAVIETVRSPSDLMSALRALERDFGRRRLGLNAARTLDVDLIAYGRRVESSPGLILPHPRAHERLFVMGPLAEILPHWLHPTLARSATALARCATVARDAAPLAARKR